LEWKENWVSFMDSLLQTEILQLDSRSLYVPTAIQKLTIDPQKHLAQLKENVSSEDFGITFTKSLKLDNNRIFLELPFTVYKNHEVLQCGGVEVRGLQASVIARRKPSSDPLLETYETIPYRPMNIMSDSSALRICTHIALENIIGTSKYKVAEWVPPIEANPNCLLSLKLPYIFGDLPVISVRGFFSKYYMK
jgi:fatty acid synthase, animal type